MQILRFKPRLNFCFPIILNEFNYLTFKALWKSTYFRPRHVDVKDELKNTAIQITCLDEDGNVLKRVTSTDEGNVEDNESLTPDPSPTGEGSGNTGGGNTGGDNGGNTGSGGDNGGDGPKGDED